eukprot:TRINITY_DN39779_c0_g1_i1.p2 TRINITY_DN39779_c0_g1~~TRINITY_DN39779_c0_g1_i1.p2  ORF type:complete len:180 (-),score=56.78 TRINITY_DN39779_c0_g1_i1:43-582(-)
MVTLGKALGGGMPVAAVGMSKAVAAVVKSGTADIVSTTGGNALAMAAAHSSLEVLSDEAYETVSKLNQRLVHGLRGVISKHGSINASVVQCGAAKGCLFFFGSDVQPKDVCNFRDVLSLGEESVEMAELCALGLATQGVWLGTSGDEEWTISTQHTEEDVGKFIEAFAQFAQELDRLID